MRPQRIILLISLLWLLISGLRAQDATGNTEQIIADIYEQVSEDTETEIDFTSLYEDLMALAENPINLNKTNKEELEKLQFLSDTQIENILYYIYKSAPLNTIYELQLIEGLDMTDIRRMLPFVSVGEGESQTRKIRLRDIRRFGKNELMMRFDRGLETKEGYRFLPEEDEQSTAQNARKYLGDPYYTYLKYRFHYRDRIQAGVTAEKDAGEQMWGNEHKGYDFYSAHVELRNFGKLKTLVLGDYRVNFGQGLVIRTDFSMGKSSYVLNVSPRSGGLKKYSSTAESNFFRGSGATLKLGKTELTAFYSNKMLDGDTTNGNFQTIIRDGLHRTANDLLTKGTVNEQVMGGNVSFTHSWFQLGATLVHTRLDHDLQPDEAIYNRFYFRGKNQTAGSVNYRIRWHKLNIFGETAMTEKSAVATINGLNFSPVSRVSLVALHRYFAKNYDTFFANTFSETSRVNNESGLYIGAEIRPVKFWKISAYVDSYRFFWPKFGINSPSIGNDFLLQADYFPKRNVAMFWRVKYEEKGHNFTDTLTTMPLVLTQPKWQARYQLNYSFGRFKFKNQLDANGYSDGVNKPSYGFSALQDVSYSFERLPLSLDIRLHIFDALNFENRFYTYEKDVLYAFSIPMAYGQGTRYYLNLRYDVNSSLSLMFKLAQTVYADDRTTISSSNEEIQGNRKTDFRFLMKWQF
ncbi:MAG TPA: helix-hairpin-helix domain-containing protein [Paludibacteraceae bacterium]|nr:helix-hairpin-helix domain-containing protein [Paludibacteraceae bacterium]